MVHFYNNADDWIQTELSEYEDGKCSWPGRVDETSLAYILFKGINASVGPTANAKLTYLFHHLAAAKRPKHFS